MNKIILTGRNALLIVMSVMLAANILGESVTTAYAASNPLDTIRQYISYMGHDWDALANLYVSGQVESYISFFNNEDCINNNVGILNVNNAEFIEAVEISYDDAKSYFSEEYQEENSKFYAVGVDYSVNEDSVFFSNGMSYSIISLVYEENTWKISDDQVISDPNELLEKGYVFSDEYGGTIEMMEARQKGILMNGDGEVFDTIGEMVTLKDNSTSGSLQRSVGTHALNSTTGVPNETTFLILGYYDASDKTKFLYYIDKNCKETFNPSPISFNNYCIAATAGECRGSEFDGRARQAIVMAIKTYTWRSLIYPRGKTQGVHIKLWKKSEDGLRLGGQQAYAPFHVDENPQVKVDYNNVKDIWMESTLRNIFDAQYNDNSDGTDMYRQKDDESQDNEAALYQSGCIHLANEKKWSLYSILNYYYAYSDVSTRNLIFFTSTGRLLYK